MGAIARFSAASFLIAIGLAVGIQGAAAHDYDLDCWQFASQADAQAMHDHVVWESGWDWMRLDEDGDGVACECFWSYYGCWTPW